MKQPQGWHCSFNWLKREPVAVAYVFALWLSGATAAEDGLGFSPSLNGEVTDNAMSIPPSGLGNGSALRPNVFLPSINQDSSIIVPLPESKVMSEPMDGSVRTTPLPVIIR